MQVIPLIEGLVFGVGVEVFDREMQVAPRDLRRRVSQLLVRRVASGERINGICLCQVKVNRLKSGKPRGVEVGRRDSRALLDAGTILKSALTVDPVKSLFECFSVKLAHVVRFLGGERILVLVRLAGHLLIDLK